MTSMMTTRRLTQLYPAKSSDQSKRFRFRQQQLFFCRTLRSGTMLPTPSLLCTQRYDEAFGNNNKSSPVDVANQT